uniref:Ubiquitin-like protease family profile domain-containing protein n=1 Tax=Oryza barthii TaxID=65489 RepID=A0A0D3F5F4_9ORYZ
MTCETKDNSNQSNQNRKRLIGPTGRTYKPTNRTDFIYETRGKKKDIIRTQAQTKKTIVYVEKEDLTQKIIDKGPPKNALRGQKKKKTNSQTSLKNSEELTKKEDPFITYINNTEDNKVMVHIEEVEVKRIRMKVLTQPEFLNDDVMDAYIQCLRYNEKGIRGVGKAFLEMAIKTGLLNIFLPINIKNTHWYLAVLNAKRHEVQILDSLAKPIRKDRPDLRRVVMDAYIQCLRYNEKGIRGVGKAFLEMAIKTGLLNVEGAHVEASKPRDKRWIRDMARDYLAFDMIFLLINIKDTHWYLAVLNAKRCEVQILYSLAKPISKDRPDLRRVKDVKTFRQDLAGILINSELSKIKDRPLLPTTT